MTTTDDTPDEAKLGIFREHEKFWAFIFLIVTIVLLVFLASTFDKDTKNATDLVMQAKLRIIDAAITGLLTITGMAAQALFRISSVDKQNAATFQKALDKVPEAHKPGDPPQEVKVVNPPEDPANVTETHAAPDEQLPEYAR